VASHHHWVQRGLSVRFDVKLTQHNALTIVELALGVTWWPWEPNQTFQNEGFPLVGAFLDIERDRDVSAEN